MDTDRLRVTVEIWTTRLRGHLRTVGRLACILAVAVGAVNYILPALLPPILRGYQAAVGALLGTFWAATADVVLVALGLVGWLVLDALGPR